MVAWRPFLKPRTCHPLLLRALYELKFVRGRCEMRKGGAGVGREAGINKVSKLAPLGAAFLLLRTPRCVLRLRYQQIKYQKSVPLLSVPKKHGKKKSRAFM